MIGSPYFPTSIHSPIGDFIGRILIGEVLPMQLAIIGSRFVQETTYPNKYPGAAALTAHRKKGQSEELQR